MRPVNLIPPEDRRGDRAPLRSGPLAYVLVGMLLLAFVGVYALVATGNSISEREASVASLERELESAQVRAQALNGFSEFASLEQARTETVTSLARSRFDWERVMRELALVIPADLSLLKLAGSVAGDAGAESAAAAEGIEAPTLSVTGCAPGQEAVARMISAIRDIDGVTRTGLSISARTDSESGGVATGVPGGAECPSQTPYTFEVTVAFDDALAEPGSGAPTAPSGDADDASGAAETARERGRAADSVDSARQRSQDAVETLVPGA